MKLITVEAQIIVAGFFCTEITAVNEYKCTFNDIEGVHPKKPHFKNVMEITNMNLRKMLSHQMKPNMVP